MKIKPDDKSIREMLLSGFYIIPRFQRPYSWDKENLADFWSDINDSDENGYFIGSMVLYRENENSEQYKVVDGQQRLTTITILMCVIRDAFTSIGESDLASGMHDIIERKDIDAKLKFTLFSETPFPFFQDSVLQFGESSDAKAEKKEEKGIEDAYKDFHQKVSSKISSIEQDTTIKEENQHDEKNKFLKTLRNKIFNLQVITVELSDEDEAYIIFETLNTRGKDLEASDLIKNHLTKLIKPANDQLDATKNAWQDISRIIVESDSSLDLSKYFHRQWLSDEEYVTEAKLYKNLKKKVKSKALAKKYLAKVKQEAPIYRALYEPSYRNWTKAEREIKNSLEAIQTFKVQQAIPALHTLVTLYDQGHLKMRALKTILRRIENFHFIFTAITSQRSSGGIAFMYSRAARDIRHAKDENFRAAEIKLLAKKLRDRIPSFEEFDIGFSELLYSREYSRQRKLVRYVLQGFDEHFTTTDAKDYEQYSIEHIASEDTDDIDEDVIAMVGNLIFVPERLNSEILRNKKFTAKKKILIDNDVPLDPILSQATQWGHDEIIDRTDYLAKIAFENIWKA